MQKNAPHAKENILKKRVYEDFYKWFDFKLFSKRSIYRKLQIMWMFLNQAPCISCYMYILSIHPPPSKKEA